MLIEIHAIQNHSPANLNRDDLGAPKTCQFGGVSRSRISSQCLKRSIRTSEEFQKYCGAIRTRRLPEYLTSQVPGKDVLPLASAVIQKCGLNKDEEEKAGKKDVVTYLSKAAVSGMVDILQKEPAAVSKGRVDKLARQFAELIALERFAPDMALAGRMLRPANPPSGNKGKKNQGDGISDDDEDQASGNAQAVWHGLDLDINAALQVGQAFSTHAAQPEVDYFVAADDIPGEHAGGAHLGETQFVSACFYKYFSIHWEMLVENLNGDDDLAAQTVGAFIRGVALTNPTGMQNSFAAHNPPDGLLIEIKRTPVSYANAFATPTAAQGERDIIAQSIAQLGQYVHDLETGYGQPDHRFWFSPNLQYSLSAMARDEEGKKTPKAIRLSKYNYKSLDALIEAALGALGHEQVAFKATPKGKTKVKR